MGSQMTSGSDDVELVTPFEVEREMVDLNRRVDAAPAIIKAHHEKVRAAKQAYKRSYALAYSRANGTQLDRKISADLATESEAEVLDSAEIEYRYVRDVLDGLKTKLRALQSVSSLMKAQMFSPGGGS